jgi:hypothetical protein
VKIVRTKRYRDDLKRLGVADEDRDAVERTIAANPVAGDVIKGLGGVRKIRFGFGGRGKRGGGRAVYFLMVDKDTAAMLMAYAKNEREDLSATDRKAALALMKVINDA